MGLGMRRDQCLSIAQLSKHQFYQPLSGQRVGRQGTTITRRKDMATSEVKEVDNKEVVDEIVAIKLNPDLPNGYRMLTRNLQMVGYYINHKKVYRLMFLHMLLEESRKRTGRNFVTYGRVAPKEPLRMIEMDIKYFWIHGTRKYAFVLTILDTFTRYVLSWNVGYSMKAIQVKACWEEVIAEYLQPANIKAQDISVEIRNDNGKQFSAHILSDFFKENQLKHVFTHPYTPEENGHVESFHSILGKALEKDLFLDLKGLEKRLQPFYMSYNNERCHGSIAGLPPSKFWALYDMQKIETIPMKNNRTKFKVKVAYQDIKEIPEVDKYEHRGIRT
jgi:transposase InsO family protein